VAAAAIVIEAVEAADRNAEVASDRSERAAIAETADLVASAVVRVLEVAVVRNAEVVPIGIGRVSRDRSSAWSRAPSGRRRVASGAKSP